MLEKAVRGREFIVLEIAQKATMRWGAGVYLKLKQYAQKDIHQSSNFFSVGTVLRGQERRERDK